jgi:hypothetical protein
MYILSIFLYTSALTFLILSNAFGTSTYFSPIPRLNENCHIGPDTVRDAGRLSSGVFESDNCCSDARLILQTCHMIASPQTTRAVGACRTSPVNHPCAAKSERASRAKDQAATGACRESSAKSAPRRTGTANTFGRAGTAYPWLRMLLG